ncbi:MaoC/PaaZ C-terminal domain-containing protein [Nocardia sp. NPDC050378]|uniref:MaoC/PaaZ C-terminal domain-containing protein n=1 Tax=Nocardia sp. NPDC050378 TaxID=3155400 RepID=UPI0033FAA383
MSKTFADLTVGDVLVGPVEISWSGEKAVLYALGVGAGQADPGQELQFTTTNSSVPQRVLPTFGTVLAGSLGMASLIAQLGDSVDMSKLLHGEQSYEQFVELPPQGSAYATATISALWDKGSAAIVEITTVITDNEDQQLCRSKSAMFFRGAGGWGGERGPSAVLVSDTDSPPDQQLVVGTRRDQPLLYRLSGDSNPLHTDPAFARRAGFPAPIMHGMSLYGITGRVLLNELCDGDPARFRSLQARFVSVVTPGDDLTVSLWRSSDRNVRFVVDDSSGKRVLGGGEFVCRD